MLKRCLLMLVARSSSHMKLFYLTFLTIFLSTICNSSIIFGFETRNTMNTSCTIIMTLFWLESQYQCVLHLNPQISKHFCNTSNIDTTYQCYTNSTKDYTLQIYNFQQDLKMTIDKIIIQDENRKTIIFQDQEKLSIYDNQHLQIQFSSNQSFIYNATELSKCIPDSEHLLPTNRAVCVLQSSNTFVDGEYEYLFWNATLNRAVYYNNHNGYYIYPYIHNDKYLWLITNEINKACLEWCSYCIAGDIKNLASDYIVDVNNCEHWVTGTMEYPLTGDINTTVKDCNSQSIIFGVKTISAINGTVYPEPVKLTLIWNYRRFQCAIEPSEPDTFYFCNTLLTSTLLAAYECDRNYSSSSDEIKFGMQIENSKKANQANQMIINGELQAFDDAVLGIDTILIKEIYYGNVISRYNIDYFNGSDILFVGNGQKYNPYNLIVFDNDTVLTNSSIIYHKMESIKCYPISYYPNFISECIRISGASSSYLNGIYKYSFWNAVSNGAVYYQELYGMYLYPFINVEFGLYSWQIDRDVSRNFAKAFCLEGYLDSKDLNGFRYVFDINNCSEWYAWGVDAKMVVDPNFKIKECIVNTENEIKFGIVTPSKYMAENGISSNELTLTLFWGNDRFQCDIIPQLAEQEYLCSSLNSLTTKCDNKLFTNPAHVYKYSYGMQIDTDGCDEVLIDRIHIIQSIKGNVIQNIYEINDFCFNSAATTRLINCVNFLTVDNKHPYNLIMFNNNSNGYDSMVVYQTSPAQCVATKHSTINCDANRIIYNTQTITIISSVIGSVLFIVVVTAILYIVYLRKRRAKYIIRNGLVVMIAIGEYDDNDIQNLPVEKDIKNVKFLFTALNYTIIPNKKKLHWTEKEIVSYLENDVGKELFDENNELKYDGLVVFISCHGGQDTIITSDAKSIDKTIIHRIISTSYKQTTTIPRIFVFDSCEGNQKCQPSTLEVGKYLECDKGTSDMEQKEPEWIQGENHPDFQLADVRASVSGYQAKANKTKGSYLIYLFTEKMRINIEKKQGKTLQEILEEIQNELVQQNRQLTKQTFNNGTGSLQFQPYDQSNSSSRGYQRIETNEDDCEDTTNINNKIQLVHA